MVEITLEGALIVVGWAVSMVVALGVGPRIIRALIAKGLIKPENPLRKAYALIFDQDVLPKVATLMEKALAPWSKKLADLDDQRVRAEEKFEGLRLEVKAITDKLEPLLAELDYEGEDGKPAKGNAIVLALSAVQRQADALYGSTLIEVDDDEHPGQKIWVPVLPNIKSLVREAIVEYAASEKGKEMQLLSLDAKDRVAAEDAQRIAEYAQQLQDPNVRAQLAQGAELKEMEDLARDLLVGDGTKKGMMSEARFNRAIALAKKRGNLEQFLGGAVGQGGGGQVGGVRKLGR